MAYNTLLDDNIGFDSTITQQFKWIDFWIWLFLFVPKYTAKQTKQSKSLIKILNVLSIIACLVIFCVIIYKTIQAVQDKTSHTPGIYLTATALAFIALILSRLLTLYYYYYCFNYPWYSPTKSDIEIANEAVNHNFVMKYYAKSLKILLFFAAAWNISDLITPSTGIAKFSYSKISFTWTRYILSFFVWWVPNFLSLYIHAVICYKYRIYLSTLMTNLNIKDYKMIYKEFQNEYSFSLRFSVQMNIAAWCFILWLDIYDTNTLGFIGKTQKNNVIHVLLWMICDVARVINRSLVYFVSGCVLSEMFQALQKEIWRKIEESIDIENNDNSEDKLLLLLQYTKENPINIAIGPLTITIKKTILFIAGFVLSKYMAQLIRVL